MRRLNKKKKKEGYFEELREKALSWFWVILFISAIFFLRSLIVEMHTEIVRISDERQHFQDEMEKEREKNQQLYENFNAEINQSIQRAINTLNQNSVINNHK